MGILSPSNTEQLLLVLSFNVAVFSFEKNVLQTTTVTSSKLDSYLDVVLISNVSSILQHGKYEKCILKDQNHTVSLEIKKALN